MGRARSTYKGEESAFRVLVEKTEGKRPLDILKAGWEDSNEMDKGVEWIYLAQGTVKWILQKPLRESVEGIDLTQDREKRRVVVKT
jgi:hypothetical protein